MATCATCGQTYDGVCTRCAVPTWNPPAPRPPEQPIVPRTANPPPPGVSDPPPHIPINANPPPPRPFDGRTYNPPPPTRMPLPEARVVGRRVVWPLVVGIVLVVIAVAVLVVVRR